MFPTLLFFLASFISLVWSSLLYCLGHKKRGEFLIFFCHSGCLEIQTAIHRISGYSREHACCEGYQTRPVASPQASWRSTEPSPCRFLPESLEDPTEGQFASTGFIFSSSLILSLIIFRIWCLLGKNLVILIPDYAILTASSFLIGWLQKCVSHCSIMLILLIRRRCSCASQNWYYLGMCLHALITLKFHMNAYVNEDNQGVFISSH